LKRRLEDLEAKAASTSASPEQKPAQLPQKSPARRKSTHVSAPGSLSTSPQRPNGMSPQQSHHRSLSGMVQLPEAAMFTEQYSRHISHSPPPALEYPMTPADPFAFGPFSTAMQYPAVTASFDPMGYSYNSYASNASTYASAPASYPTKTDFYPDIDVNTFSFQYASTPVAAMDNNSYSDSMPQVIPPFFLT
jgi:hypothetical protein